MQQCSQLTFSSTKGTIHKSLTKFFTNNSFNRSNKTHCCHKKTKKTEYPEYNPFSRPQTNVLLYTIHFYGEIYSQRPKVNSSYHSQNLVEIWKHYSNCSSRYDISRSEAQSTRTYLKSLQQWDFDVVGTIDELIFQKFPSKPSFRNSKYRLTIYLKRISRDNNQGLFCNQFCF